MRNASGHQCKVKMSGSEKKVNEKTYDISLIKRVTKKFLKVSRCSRAKQRQRNVQKKLCKVAFFANQTYCCFSRSPVLPSPLSITRFYIFFEQTIKYYRELRFQPWLNPYIIKAINQRPDLWMTHSKELKLMNNKNQIMII